MKTSVVQDKSYAFALRIIAPEKWLRAQKELELASQILRVGTAIGSNAEEALASFGKNKFAKIVTIFSALRPIHAQ